VTETLSCNQVGCPIASDGRCLEGFPHGIGCPNAHPLAVVAAAAGDGEDDLDGGEYEEEEEGGGGYEEETGVDLGGDAALTLKQADLLAAHQPCRVVLVAGEFESGKTTLVAEFYARFLEGPFEDAIFGGSQTLRALDVRLHPAREASGETKPTTDRTADSDMRLLHLRVRREGALHNLLLSDVRGEFFENVVDGAPVEEEVPLAARADVCVLAVDGAAVAQPGERQVAFTRAKLLLGGLVQEGGLSTSTPVLVVVTKADLLEGPARQWAEHRLTQLCDWALKQGVQAVPLFVSARPDTGTAREGLGLLFAGLLPSPPTTRPSARDPEPGDRQFWNQPEVDG